MQVASYGDERFVDSVAAMAIVKTDNDGKKLIVLKTRFFFLLVFHFL